MFSKKNYSSITRGLSTMVTELTELAKTCTSDQLEHEAAAAEAKLEASMSMETAGKIAELLGQEVTDA